MNSESANAEFTDEQLRIRVHHVGGIGDFGPISHLKIFGDDIEWIGYDASEDSLSALAPMGSRFLLVNKCIGKTNSVGRFNIMKEPSASSVFPCAPSAEKYTWITYQWRPFVRNGKTLIWGEHTRVVKEVTVEFRTLDHLVENGEVPQIDVISMDTQGSDYDILVGASKVLSSSVVCVVGEVMFAELYAGQALFCDIQDHLRKHKFRFCEFLFSQVYNTAPYPFELQGKGFFTVGEALFLKDVHALIDDAHTQSAKNQCVAQCLKLAAIAAVYDHLDFSLEILYALREKSLLSLDKWASSTNITYLRLLRDLVRAAGVVESRSPPLTYDEGRRYGRAPDLPSAKPDKLKAVRYLIKRLFVRPIEIITRRNLPLYYGSISKVLHTYGLVRVARAHNIRLVMYHLGMFWPPQNWFARLEDKLFWLLSKLLGL